MMCDERKIVRPSSRASRTSPKNVCWTSGSRPDVGSSRISRSGRCCRATTRPTFCLLPFEYSLNLRLGSRSIFSISSAAYAGVDAAAQVGEVLDRLGAGQAVVQVELAGQVADAPVDRDRVDGRLDAEDLGPPRGRPDEVEQDAHRRRLPRPVGPEEPEDLALLDVEVQLDDAPMGAVGLRQPFGLDDRGHRVAPFLPVVPARSCWYRSRSAGTSVSMKAMTSWSSWSRARSSGVRPSIAARPCSMSSRSWR